MSGVLQFNFFYFRKLKQQRRKRVLIFLHMKNMCIFCIYILLFVIGVCARNHAQRENQRARKTNLDWSIDARAYLPFSNNDYCALNPPLLPIYKGKIGFMFLAKEDHRASQSWEDFFNFTHPYIKKNPDLYYRILYHPKSARKMGMNSFFRQFLTFGNVQTKWGDFSIVKATLLLLEEMMKLDDQVEYFVLLSDSCVPLLPFHVLYEQIFEKGVSRFTFHSPYKTHEGCSREIANNLAKSKFSRELHLPKGMCLKHQQFFTLRREHAKLILDNTEKFISMRNLPWPDEGYFGSGLLSLPEIYQDRNARIHFDRFEDFTFNGKFAKNTHVYYPRSSNCEVRRKWGAHPLSIGMDLLDFFAKNTSCQFVRKVPDPRIYSR